MTFVISSGQLEALERPALPALMPASSMRIADRRYESYEAIWRTQPQVRTVVGFLARNIAQLGLHVFERVSETDRRRLRTHPLAMLLARPLPPQFKTSRYRLINSLMHDLGIYDNAYWVKIKAGDERGLLRLPPREVTPIGDNPFAAEAYQVTGNRGRREIPAEQVVHFFGYNPDDPRHGVSPMETLRRLLAEDYAANGYREQMWRNGARTSGYLKRPVGAPEWGDPAREKFRAQWRSQYTGDGNQAGGTPILEDGMEFVPAAFNPEQAQYLETRKLTREEVAAHYFIPPPMVGILDHATFSNITEQHKMLYQDTLGPWLEMIQEDIELQLLPDLESSDRVYVEFNIGEKLKGSFEEQAKSIQSLVGRPVLTADEGRALLNRNALGGDAAQLVTPMNVLIGGQASSLDSGSQNVGKALDWRRVKALRGKQRAGAAWQRKAEQVLVDLFNRQRAAVAEALGQKASGDYWDADLWDKEMGNALYGLSTGVAGEVGPKAAETLGFQPGDYDEARTLAWLRTVSDSRAVNINTATLDQIEAALASEDDAATPDAVFDLAVAQRAPSAAASIVTSISGFAVTEAARQLGGTSKTWKSGPHSRPEHAAMDGETVALDAAFSNGLQWPADSGDPAEVAGCNCAVTVSA